MRIRRRSIGLLSFVLTAGIFLLVGLTFLPETEKEIPDSPSLVFLEKAKAEPTLLSERQMSEKDTLPSSETVPSYVLEEFETILQLPELPTGCEITAMTMALRYYGFSADKVEMATEYLPTAAANLYYGDDGRLYGPDLNRYFVGDPTTLLGYICGTEAIVTAANAYLADQGSSLRAVDQTGASLEEVYQFVREDTPVVVWVTISMALC